MLNALDKCRLQSSHTGLASAANSKAEGRKRSPLPGQEAAPGGKCSRVDERATEGERKDLMRVARAGVSPLKLMGGAGGYRDVFDVAVAVQTAQLPIQMAAAGTFKAAVSLGVYTLYSVHTRACGV